jgi:hypothetical protein
VLPINKRDILKKDYLGPFRLEGKEIKGLAIAVYGQNSVKAEYMKDLPLN